MNNISGFYKKHILLIVALISMAFALGFSVYALITYQVDASIEDTVAGNIFIDNDSPTDVARALNFGIDAWENNATFNITYQNKTYDNILFWFEFDLATTMDFLVFGAENDVYFTISDTNKGSLIEEMSEVFGDDLLLVFDDDAFISDIVNDLKQMYYLKSYHAEEYLSLESKDSIIDSFVMNSITPLNVTAISSTVSQIDIPSFSRFSLLSSLSDKSLSNEQLSIIASGIEKVILKSYFSGITKSQYINLPSWATPGGNVRILKVNHIDFQFYNDLELAYYITIELENSTSLRFTLHGYPNSDSIDIDVSDDIILPFETQIFPDNTINALTDGVVIEETLTTWIYSIVDQVGKNGYLREYTRILTDASGTIESKFLMNEYSSPITEIIRQNIVTKGG